MKINDDHVNIRSMFNDSRRLSFDVHRCSTFTPSNFNFHFRFSTLTSSIFNLHLLIFASSGLGENREAKSISNWFSHRKRVATRNENPPGIHQGPHFQGPWPLGCSLLRLTQGIRRALCPGRVRSSYFPCPIGRSDSFN